MSLVEVMGGDLGEHPAALKSPHAGRRSSETVAVPPKISPKAHAVASVESKQIGQSQTDRDQHERRGDRRAGRNVRKLRTISRRIEEGRRYSGRNARRYVDGRPGRGHDRMLAPGSDSIEPIGYVAAKIATPCAPDESEPKRRQARLEGQRDDSAHDAAEPPRDTGVGELVKEDGDNVNVPATAAAATHPSIQRCSCNAPSAANAVISINALAISRRRRFSRTAGRSTAAAC